MSSSLFHPGPLSTAISLAISEHKLVACFVADHEAASTTWENEWLPELEEVITEQAVLIKLSHGSTEAGFLAAFCKISSAPTLVVVREGKVIDQIEGDVSRDDFTERLLAALGLGGGDEVEGVQAEEGKEVDIGDNPAPTDVAQAVSAIASAVLPSSTTSRQGDTASTPSTLFPDRAARHQASHAQASAAETAALKSRQDARRKEAEDAHAHHTGKGKGKQPATEEDDQKRKSRESYLQQQRKKNEEAKHDRQRVLAQIEADKQNRKTRFQSQQAQAQQTPLESPLPASRLADTRRSVGASGMCNLQIRLFDGSSIRSRFPTTTTLAKDVREWVREQAPAGSGGADIPFTFRQILAPQPSRSIEVEEEHRTLAHLELAPSATLVLVPVSGAVGAYADGEGGWLGWGSGLMSSAYGALPNVGYYLPSFSRLYMGGTADAVEPGNTDGAAMAGADSESPGGVTGQARGAKTRTLADQRAEARDERDKRTEFYNGNSSAFESRKDGKDGDAGGKEG
ncbi:hypothetical protein LTR15_008970 [Elasticomyces elasticus]|nr:hypothetical protein LTR15_008970 [Elasticomyces elasticus]